MRLSTLAVRAGVYMAVAALVLGLAELISGMWPKGALLVYGILVVLAIFIFF